MPFPGQIILEQWPVPNLLLLLLTIHCVIGLIGTAIAHRKGRPLKLWIVLGLVCGTAAFLASLLMKPQATPRA